MPGLSLNLGTLADTVNTVDGSIPVNSVNRSALKVVQDDGTLVKLVNVTSPLDRPSTVKITNTRISNVYQTLAKGTVPIGNQSPNTSGQAIFIELNASASSVVGGVTQIVPLQGRLELKLPNHADLTNTVVIDFLSSLLSVAHANDGGTCVPVFTDMMRGVLFPD